MKKKALTLLIGVTVAATTLLAACSAGNTQLQLTPNWQESTSPTGELSKSFQETLTYDVTFKASTPLFTGYTVQYCVDADGNDQAGIYETTVSGNSGQYTLTTTCSIPVLYTYNGDTEPFTETKTSTVVFKMTDSRLQPVESYVEIESHSPVNATPDKMEDCFNHYKYSVAITYTSATAAKVVFKDYVGSYLGKKIPTGEEFVTANYSFEIENDDYTYLDNEQLYFALRGLDNDAMQSSANIDTYNYALSKTETTNLTLSAKDQSSTTAFKDVTVNKGAVSWATRKISYNAVTLAINAKEVGSTMELWYAKTTSDTDNEFRNVLLRIKEPIAYSIGTLTYNLKSADWSSSNV
ncbi:MAG: hypothetical protein IJY11_01910 [Clostridia bacterium]|nr:hypothetical protein [Clostridia bacterium]